MEENKNNCWKVLSRWEEISGDLYRGLEKGRFCECQLMRDFIEQVDHEYIQMCDNIIKKIDTIKRNISLLYPELIIPEGTTKVPEKAFEFWGKGLDSYIKNRSGLKYIFIPGSVKQIDSYVFFRNDNLDELVLSEGIEII